jgi:tripartite-type tricarboxylate transporter receptor subunit TctC
VVPFAAGGSSDLVARTVAHKVGEALGQPVIVENKPGSGGNIGSDHVAKAPLDGSTILMGVVGPITVNPSLFGNLPYDPLRDFVPIRQAVSVSNMLAVHPSVVANTVRESGRLRQAQSRQAFLEHRRDRHGRPHGVGAVQSMAGLEMTVQRSKGAAPAVNDAVDGQVTMTFEALLTAPPHAKADKLKAIAVTTSMRSSLLPSVPTIAEAGLPGDEANNWYGFLAPAQTPALIASDCIGRSSRSWACPASRGGSRRSALK